MSTLAKQPTKTFEIKNSDIRHIADSLGKADCVVSFVQTQLEQRNPGLDTNITHFQLSAMLGMCDDQLLRDIGRLQELIGEAEEDD